MIGADTGLVLVGGGLLTLAVVLLVGASFALDLLGAEPSEDVPAKFEPESGLERDDPAYQDGFGSSEEYAGQTGARASMGLDQDQNLETGAAP